jgi:class 3 adenylate cyclase/tetratricopeptide (TPR) repeat protein
VTTETVTVLFTDLVGSTELAARLGPAGADEVRRIHFGLLRDAVARHDGTEVKNLGDGIMVVFTGPSQALSCAVAMQQAIDRHNRIGGEPLAIRVGISAGETTVEEGDYFGEPVVEAARLCAGATGGRILLTDVVRAMSRGRGHVIAPLGELPLKGLPEPVAVCQLAWEPEEAAGDVRSIPLQTRVAAPVAVGFVGRAAERELLAVAMKSVMAGDGERVVLIAGEGGMGKTTLAFESAKEAHTAGAVVLYGRCDEDLGLPYQPIVEALSHYGAHAPEEWLLAHDTETMATMARLVPALTRRLPDLPAPSRDIAPAELIVLVAAVTSLLADLAREAPVVLILDDLHWADRPTVQLLRAVAGAGISRLLVLGTFRDVELSASHPLSEALAALRRDAGVERLSLDGLGDSEILAFLESAAGHDMDEDGVALSHELLRETDGNPFYVREVLLHLVESGAIVQGDDGRWAPTEELERVGLPQSVREVVGARVARLGSDAATVLAAAAVIGQEFDLELLCAMTERSEDQVLDNLEAAGRVALVVESATAPGRFRFSHALIQHTIYEDLGLTRQTRLHQRAAAELERLCGGDVEDRVGELAHHYLAATRPAEVEKAAAYARLAGDRALASFAPDEAARWYQRTLDVLGSAGLPAERADILVRLGTAQRLGSNHAFHDTLLQALQLAHQCGADDLVVKAALTNNRNMGARTGVVDADLVDGLQIALGIVGPHDSPERARLLSTLTMELAFDPDPLRRLRLADEAVEVARRLGDPAALYDALTRTFLALSTPDHAERNWRNLREATTLSDKAVDPDPLFSLTADLWFAVASVQLGRLDGVTELTRLVEARVAQYPSAHLQWTDAVVKCWLAQLAGDIEVAERENNVALEQATLSGQPEALSFYAAVLITIRRMQGRFAEILPLVVQAADADQALPALKGAVAFGEALAGNTEAARALIDEFLPQNFHPFDGNFLSAMSLWSEAAAEAGHLEGAAAITKLIEPYPDQLQVGCVIVLPGMAHGLARLADTLGHHEEADRYFAQALEVHERLEARFLTALTKACWALSLAERDPHRARTLAREALEAARADGYGEVEEKARRVLEP